MVRYAEDNFDAEARRKVKPPAGGSIGGGGLSKADVPSMLPNGGLVARSIVRGGFGGGAADDSDDDDDDNWLGGGGGGGPSILDESSIARESVVGTVSAPQHPLFLFFLFSFFFLCFRRRRTSVFLQSLRRRLP